jgi:hypothetical protein
MGTSLQGFAESAEKSSNPRNSVVWGNSVNQALSAGVNGDQ